MRLSGKVALITGAASGMGRAAARLFAEQGAKIVATDLVAAKLDEVVKEVKAAGGNIIGVPGDVTRAKDVERAVREGVKAFGKLNVLYNNAGIFPDDDTSVVET